MNRSANSASIFFNTNFKSKATCGAGVDTITGIAESEVGVTLNVSLCATTGTAIITLTGPSGVWYGVGLDTTMMTNAPYAIIVDGAGAVTERTLGRCSACLGITSRRPWRL